MQTEVSTSSQFSKSPDENTTSPLSLRELISSSVWDEFDELQKTNKIQSVTFEYKSSDSQSNHFTSSYDSSTPNYLHVINAGFNECINTQQHLKSKVELIDEIASVTLDCMISSLGVSYSDALDGTKVTVSYH